MSRKFYYTLHPRLCVIIGSGKVSENVINFMAATWITPISEDLPTVGFSCSKETYTCELIKKYKQFSVNIVKDVKLIWQVGTTSGKEINKVEKFKIKFKAGKVLDVPIIEDCLAYLECRVIKEVEVSECIFFIGEVKNWEAQNFDEYGFKNFWELPYHKAGRAFVFLSKNFVMI
mgnify:CR=1 FL=1